MYTYTRRAHYHETDKMGIIHHSNYVKWMEEARIEFMDHIGMSMVQLESHGISIPVSKISVDYRKPVYFDDVIQIILKVEKYSGVKAVLSYEFVREDTGETVTSAKSHHGFLKDGRVVSLKKALPEMHGYMQAAAEEDLGSE
ncbi:MAG: acyl-CoA thioesterase [Clostridia bacterium]|nr:acyl-CoA thioesterase [Clostridia bacterium]